jgi:hypothetical protein
MSHFTVMVKVTQDRLRKHDGEITDAVAEMLAPYQENNMGDCPKEYLKFHDMTEDIGRTDKNERIEADSFMGEKYPESVGKTLLEHYGDEETFIKEYHGYKKDEETGKYGYWENPNRKWDWYQVGGRWSGLLRIKELVTPIRGEKSWMIRKEGGKDDPHTADAALVEDIDFEGMNSEATVKAEEFYQKYLRSKEIEAGRIPKEGDDVWVEHDVHSVLYSLGIRTCVKHREAMVDEKGQPIMEEVPNFNEPGKTETKQKWSEPKFEDVAFTLEDLKSKYVWYWEFSTYSVLDDSGWHEKGQMGWWGCSSDSAEDREKWGQSFTKRFIDDESPDTLIVVVDCHI